MLLLFTERRDIYLNGNNSLIRYRSNIAADDHVSESLQLSFRSKQTGNAVIFSMLYENDTNALTISLHHGALLFTFGDESKLQSSDASYVGSKSYSDGKWHHMWLFLGKDFQHWWTDAAMMALSLTKPLQFREALKANKIYFGGNPVSGQMRFKGCIRLVDFGGQQFIFDEAHNDSNDRYQLMEMTGTQAGCTRY